MNSIYFFVASWGFVSKSRDRLRTLEEIMNKKGVWLKL